MTQAQVQSEVSQAANLIDNFGRQVRYLRLSVTDRCNLRCTYCMAEDMTFLPKARVLSLEEMILVGKAFVELGVEKIRLTGGEPLVRKGIEHLASELGQLKASGLRELVMTSNGVLLDQYAAQLKDAGMSRINISIDSLKSERFKDLTRFGELEDVLRGIEAAKAQQFDRIKLNAVILNGVNDDEVIDLTQFAVDSGFDISFIEEMPLGEIDSHLRQQSQVSSLSIRETLEQHFSTEKFEHMDAAAGPSRYIKLANTNTKVGFISPMSNNFCSTCNRVRVTAEGQLLLCLGNENSVDLKAVLRDERLGNEQERLQALKTAIVDSMTHKPERHYFDPNDITITRHMSATGG